MGRIAAQSHMIVTAPAAVAVPGPTTMSAVPISPRQASRVVHQRDGESVVLTIAGPLDLQTGTALVAAVNEAVAAGSVRLDIDLSGIDSFDDDGAAALLACRDVAARLEGGLHYRTCSGGPGQDVLLHAYADEG